MHASLSEEIININVEKNVNGLIFVNDQEQNHIYEKVKIDELYDICARVCWVRPQ